MTFLDTVIYYSSLLILQYLGQPNAVSTVQAKIIPILMGQFTNTIQTFNLNGVPASGQFTVQYGVNVSASIAWNATNSQIQSAIQSIIGTLSVVSVTGSLGSESFTVLLNNAPNIGSFTIASNTLKTAGSVNILLTVSGNLDQGQLPLQVLNGYNLTGITPAVGKQLDVLGKYAGVQRTGQGFNSPITLNDTDFLSLIQMAIIRNNSGSSLSQIESLINQFFPGEFLIFDYQNMQMSYLISSSVGSQNLVQLFVTEGLLPRPMAVAMSVVYAPVINTFFGFRTYDGPNNFASPFNTYDSYLLTRPWLSYDQSVIP